MLITVNISQDVTYRLNAKKNTWGVKKVRGQEEPVTKSFDIK